MQLNSIGGVMLGSTRKGRETAGVGSDRQAANFLPFSRRSFLAKTSYFGASYAAAKLIPLPALAAQMAVGSRVSQTPIVDKGFASVRKVGEGLYATISDPSKGYQTLCNGGFLAGKDGALMIEGFGSAAEAPFQMGALRLQSHGSLKDAPVVHHHVLHC